MDCGLAKIGDLQFYHTSVACTNVANSFIYLCFNENAGDWKRCRKSTGPLAKFTETELSLYSHQITFIASSTSKLKLNYIVHIDFQQRFLLLKAVKIGPNKHRGPKKEPSIVRIRLSMAHITRLRFTI